jgi:hypothetical protein
MSDNLCSNDIENIIKWMGQQGAASSTFKITLDNNQVEVLKMQSIPFEISKPLEFNNISTESLKHPANFESFIMQKMKTIKGFARLTKEQSCYASQLLKQKFKKKEILPQVPQILHNNFFHKFMKTPPNEPPFIIHTIDKDDHEEGTMEQSLSLILFAMKIGIIVMSPLLEKIDLMRHLHYWLLRWKLNITSNQALAVVLIDWRSDQIILGSQILRTIHTFVKKKWSTMHKFKKTSKIVPSIQVVDDIIFRPGDYVIKMIISPNYGNQTLESMVQKNVLSNIQLKSILKQVLTSLSEAYKQFPNFRHNDLHTQNVILEKRENEWIATIIDFDLSYLGKKYPQNLKAMKWKINDTNTLYDVYFFINCLHFGIDRNEKIKLPIFVKKLRKFINHLAPSQKHMYGIPFTYRLREQEKDFSQSFQEIMKFCINNQIF